MSNNENSNAKKENQGDKKSQIKYNISDISKYNISKINDNEDISDMKEITFKISVIGDVAVGKSSIIQRLTKEGEKFNENYKATIGFDIFKYKCKVKDTIINLNIWDTCGLVDFSASTPSLYKNAALVIVVYSIDNKESFEHLVNWINALKENTKPDILVFIVGNKSDLEDKRQVKIEEGKAFMEERNYNFFLETSAKENKHIKELFEQAFAQLYEYHYKEVDDKREDFTTIKEKDKRISLSQKEHKKNKKKKFC